MAITQIVRHFEISPSPTEVKELNPKMMDFGFKNSVSVILKSRNLGGGGGGGAGEAVRVEE